MLTLYRKDIEGRGSLFCGGSYILFMKGFRYLEEKEVIILESIEVLTPEGTMLFEAQKRCLDFLWLLFGEPVKMESFPDYLMRNRQIEMGGDLKNYIDSIELYNSIDEEWVDKTFQNPSRLELSPRLIEIEKELEELEKLKQTPAAKYAKTEKGQLSQRAYRLSEKGRENSIERRKNRQDQDREFKEAALWIENHPGKTYVDYLKETQEEAS